VIAHATRHATATVAAAATAFASVVAVVAGVGKVESVRQRIAQRNGGADGVGGDEISEESVRLPNRLLMNWGTMQREW
jgi:hypothetical protein